MNIKKILSNFKNYFLNYYHLIIKNNVIHQNINLTNYIDFRETFLDHNINEKFNEFKKELKKINLPDSSGGINKGDAKALFFLLSFLKPKDVLEIGTHIGSSTVIFAKALFDINSDIETVDIIDVNNENIAHWKKFNSNDSPINNLKNLNIYKNIKFINSNSLTYIKNTKKKYDFIFLDGSHNSDIVFEEVNLALNKLKEKGIIVLHDYYKCGKAIWKGHPTVFGPYLALKKILQHNKDIKVHPFLNFPWETKLQTNKTSLAFLYKNKN